MYDVLLIGAGQIGFTYDMDLNQASARSHVKGLLLHDNFHLRYVIEPNKDIWPLIKNVAKNVEIFDCISKLPNQARFAVAVIATPTHMHAKNLAQISDRGDIRLIVVEKPLFYEASEYDNLDEKIKNKLLINYPRRFDPVFGALKQEIRQENNALTKIIIKYSRGLKNNGSHAIDMLRFLLDNPKVRRCQILGKINDYSENDLTYDAFVEFSDSGRPIPCFFVAFDERHFSIFEIELYSEHRCYQIRNFGREIRISMVENDEVANYKSLQSGNIINTNYKFAMLNLYRHVDEVLKGHARIGSSYDDEAYTHQVCNIITECKFFGDMA